MALIKCTECGKEISSEAKSCPNCGKLLKKSKNFNSKMIYLVLGIVVLVGGIIFGLVQFNKNKELELSPIDYATRESYILLKDSLLEPESIKVYECHAWGSNSEENMRSGREEGIKVQDIPDDLVIVYYHIGAKNQAGGVSDSKYVFVYTVNGRYLRSISKNDYEEKKEGTPYDENDIAMAWLQVQYTELMGSWESFGTTYSAEQLAEYETITNEIVISTETEGESTD